jgi:AdoMet-dependent rRNA methyltransferase SPB1
MANEYGKQFRTGNKQGSSNQKPFYLKCLISKQYDFRDLPDWFLQEEQYHMRKPPAVDPEAVEYYKNKQKDINVKTIKKVVEAKARKKRLLMKKMNKAKKRAASIMENEDLGSREKGKEIDRLYKRAASTKKREVVYSVAKKFVAAKRAKRPAGVKGAYKQVDPRMKKDTFGKRSGATSKRVQKRNLKGKKTNPNR